MFCPEGEVVVLPKKQVDNTELSTLILASTRGLVKEYMKALIQSVNTEFSPLHSKNL